MPLAILYEVPGMNEETENNVERFPTYSCNLLRLLLLFGPRRKTYLRYTKRTQLHDKPNYVVGHSEFVTKLVMSSEGCSYIAV
jgi:hypothetical protein